MRVRNFEVTLVARGDIKLPGVRVILVNNAPGVLGWIRRLIEVRRVVREVNPDIVHGHYITSYGFWAAISGIRPLVLTAWGSDILVTPKKSWLMRALVCWTLSRADIITADSVDMLNEIKKYPRKGKAIQVQWGVDMKVFQPRRRRGRAGFAILSLRAWSENYNIDTIVRAFADLNRQRPDLGSSLHLFGGGPLEQSLRELVHTLKVEGQVIFHGKVSEDRLAELMGQGDVSVSVPTSDATAMSLLESMAMELPVIVSDLPANRQWIGDANGRVVPPRDVAALTSALLSLANAPEERAAMGRVNRLEVEMKASRQHEMDNMAQLYTALFHD